MRKAIGGLKPEQSNRSERSTFIPFTTAVKGTGTEQSPYTAYINPNGIGSHYYGLTETKIPPRSQKQYYGERKIGKC